MSASTLLLDLGWAADFAESFTPYAAAGAVPGRVARVDRSAYDVVCPDGLIRASAALPLQRAAADDPAAGPTVGDWVAVDLPRGDDRPATVLAVLDRRTVVVRGAGRRTTAAQVLAANVDVLLLVTAAAPPTPLNRVERFLTLAWDSGARPVVVLTKTDLVTNAREMLARLATAAPGADLVAVSALTGDGVADVAALVGPGVTAALLGASGAGKSTLANAILGEARLLTSGLRSDGKGRHTTARRELVPVPGGGVLLDTPGLRGVQLWDAPEALAQTFSDIVDLAVDCRFRDCSHRAEPGCAVRAAVDAGVLEARRVDSWFKLQREQAWQDRRRDVRARLEEQKRWKAIHKQMRDHGRP